MHFRSNKKNGLTISLNDSIGYDKDGNEVNLIDVVKDDSMDIADSLHIKDNIHLLKEDETKEIAKKLHISRSYVSRIEKRALTKVLREFLKNNKDL